eukprot:ANDGO_04352.mRNA.1 hypothetical protein
MNFSTASPSTVLPPAGRLQPSGRSPTQMSTVPANRSGSPAVSCSPGNALWNHVGSPSEALHMSRSLFGSSLDTMSRPSTSAAGSPSSDMSNHQSALNRISNLKEKLSEIDVDLKNQKLARATKDAKVTSLSDTLRILQVKQGNLERKNQEMEETIKKLCTQMASERVARDALEKTLSTVMDDRSATLQKTLVDSIRRVESEVESLKNRMGKVEDLASAEKALLDREIKSRTDLETMIVAKHTDSIAHLSKELIRERQARIDESETLKKTLQSSICTLQSSFEQEKAKKERQFENQDTELKRAIEDSQVAVDTLKREIERSISKQILQLENKTGEYEGVLENDRKTRDELFRLATLRTQEHIAVVKAAFRDELSSVEAKLGEALRSVDDRLWRVSHSLESEIESRELDSRRLIASIDDERRAREAETTDISQLLERSFLKMREGFERV